MDTFYFLDIVEQNGLYTFNRDQSVIKQLSQYGEVSMPSSDNISTLSDITVNIEDETPDTVLLKLNQNCSHLMIALIKALSCDYCGKILVLTSRVTDPGTVYVNDIACGVISTVSDLAAANLEMQVYSIETVFDAQISYSGLNYVSVMQNGLSAFISGSYPSAGQLSNLKHLMLTDAELEIDLANNTELFDINSAIIYPKYDPCRFDKIKSIEKATFTHIHQMDGNYIHLDNMNEFYPNHIENYSTCKDDTFSYLKITNSNDISFVKSDIDEYKKKGTLAKLGNRFVNECAWGISPCILTKLFRGVVDAQHNFYPCPECSESIGSVYDDSFELTKNASRIFRKSQVDRACDSCAVKQQCTKCAMLPNGISAEEYCGLMRYEGAMDYFAKTTLLSMILGSGKIVAQKDFRKISVTSRYKPLVLPLNMIDTSHENKRKSVIFVAFKYKRNYYVLGYKLSKIYRTDERFIFIAEMLNYGVPTAKMVQLYSEKYGFSHEESNKHIVEAYQMIKDAVIL